MSMTQTVVKAIDNLFEINSAYAESTINQRLISGKGSVTYFSNTYDLLNTLKTAFWEPYSHPSISKGCKGYVTYDIPGELGIVDISELPNDFLLSYDDSKNTGKASLCVKDIKRLRTGFTVLITGEEEGKDVMFTFHPGEPITPSVVDSDLNYYYNNIVFSNLQGKTITVKDALKRGFEYAKIV
jgi:hypothetical protein